jgi:hypothetical protein
LLERVNVFGLDKEAKFSGEISSMRGTELSLTNAPSDSAVSDETSSAERTE